jgi:hypothetical protein
VWVRWVLLDFLGVFVLHCCVIQTQFLSKLDIWIYIYIHTHTHIYIYIYKYIYLASINLGISSLYRLKAGKWGCNFISHLYYSETQYFDRNFDLNYVKALQIHSTFLHNT